MLTLLSLYNNTNKEEKIEAKPIDKQLPDGHICEKGEFKPYIQLVCSKCSPKNLETPKDVYFAHKLPTNDEQIKHLRNCILNHSTCIEKMEAELQGWKGRCHDISVKLVDMKDEFATLADRYSESLQEQDRMRETAKPILDRWDAYVKSGQSVTIGTGETTICIPTRHIQAFAYVVRRGET